MGLFVCHTLDQQGPHDRFVYVVVEYSISSEEEEDDVVRSHERERTGRDGRFLFIVQFITMDGIEL
jgi:hypothetical protein